MKSSVIAFVTGTLFSILSAPTVGQSSKEWVDVKDPKELRAIYSNKTLKGKTGDGTPFVGHYRSDGKGILIMGNQRIPRTWEVKGTEVCVTDPNATNCFRLQRHRTNRNEILLEHVKDRWFVRATMEDGIPQF
jgi:hypothetical protein